MENSIDEKGYERYLQERCGLEETRHKICESYDKTFLTLTSGALAVSMTFITDIAKNPTHKSRLLLAWILFGSCIMLHLIVFRLSIYAYNKEIDELDREQQANLDGKNYKAKKNWWTIATEIFNSINLLLFVAGLISLGIFVFYNL